MSQIHLRERQRFQGRRFTRLRPADVFESIFASVSGSKQGPEPMNERLIFESIFASVSGSKRPAAARAA